MLGQVGGEDRWIRRLGPPREGAPRLVCFPFAGGSAGYFRPLAVELGPDVELLAVQYPGRQDRLREPALDDIGSLAERIREAMAPWTDRPYAFLGHSMGALVAFETARRMGPEGPCALLASARSAPCVHRPGTVHLRDDAGLLAQLRALGGADEEVLRDADLMGLLLPAIRADYRAVETYRPSEVPAVLDVPVTALAGREDPAVEVAEMDAWRHHTSAAFRLHTFPGGHFYLHQRVAEVAAVVAGALPRVAF